MIEKAEQDFDSLRIEEKGSSLSILWSRLYAMCLNIASFGLALVLLTIITDLCMERVPPESNLWVLPYLFQLCLIAIFFSFAVFNEASIGFTIAGLTLCRKDGQRLGRKRALFRMLGGLLLFPLSPISGCIMLFRPTQSLADIFFNTIAVRRKKPIRRGFEVLQAKSSGSS